MTLLIQMSMRKASLSNLIVFLYSSLGICIFITLLSNLETKHSLVG